MDYGKIEGLILNSSKLVAVEDDLTLTTSLGGHDEYMKQVHKGMFLILDGFYMCNVNGFR